MQAAQNHVASVGMHEVLLGHRESRLGCGIAFRNRVSDVFFVIVCRVVVCEGYICLAPAQIQQDRSLKDAASIPEGNIFLHIFLA